MSVPSQFLSELRIRQLLAMVGWTVLTYDYLLTLDLEIDYIWRAPRSAVKTIFLLNRYGTLIGQSFITLQEVGILSNGSRKFCAHLQWFQSLFVLFSSETTRTLLLLRAWALWRCSYRVVVSLVSIYVLYVVVLSGFTSYILFDYNAYFEFPYLSETGVCVVYAVVKGAWILGLISLSLDTAVFAVIAFYLYKLCKGSRQIQHSPLLRLLVRDTVLFYMMNVFHDVVTAVVLSAFVNDPRALLQVAFSFPLLTVVGQRVVLNLRGFQSTPYTTQRISRFVDRRIASIQRRSIWQSVDLWMNDLHQELQMNEEQYRYRMTRATESQATVEDSYALSEVIHTESPQYTWLALNDALYELLSQQS